MVVDRKEIFRYLGYRGKEPDAGTKQLVEVCIAELLSNMEPRMIVRESYVTMKEGMVECGYFCTRSKKLAVNLSGCDRMLLMAATLGIGADRLLYRYGKTQIAKAVVMQATATAVIEAYCNELCEQWKAEYKRLGMYLRPRFSPGYGDFSLECQKEILNGLNAATRIGLTLTDGGMMMPSKSVTAVIGLSRKQERCPVSGCENCEKTTCLYRR